MIIRVLTVAYLVIANGNCLALKKRLTTAKASRKLEESGKEHDISLSFYGLSFTYT